MTKQGTGGRFANAGRVVNVRAQNGQSMSEVSFGNVTISGTKPSAKIVAMNVEHSTKALERVSKKLIMPGVAIRTKRDVPHYSVAEGETGVFVRRLNGRTERGRMVNGDFQVVLSLTSARRANAAAPAIGRRCRPLVSFKVWTDEVC
jgi:hypothetical protein